MTAAIVPLVDQILACSSDDRKAAFARLAREIIKHEPRDRPVPLIDENGECFGVYWPFFVSSRKTPPELPPAERVELLRRHASLDDAEDWDKLLEN